MQGGIVISDTGPIFSLALVDQLGLLSKIFNKIYIPKAVWEELTRDKSTQTFERINNFFKDKVKEVSSNYELTFIMDYGESEAVRLYKELNADFLLIDDRKARAIAESLNINCIGTIGLIATAKENKLIKELRPIFKYLLQNKRYYSVKLLNHFLEKYEEEKITRA